MTLTQPTVFFVDDAPDGALSPCWFLEENGRHVVCYCSVREMLAGFQPAHPCCLVLDLKSPEIPEHRILEELRESQRNVSTIIITDPVDGHTALKWMRLGAVDICTRPVDLHRLLATVDDALSHEAALERQRQMTADARRRLAGLTPRERQLFDLVVEGKSYKEMAAALGISPRTVEHHRAHIAAKLGMDRVADLVRLGIHAGVEQQQELELAAS